MSKRPTFSDFAADLMGLPVNCVWQGYGAAIFLEFGNLTPVKRRDGTDANPNGEFSLMLDCDWRIEKSRSILCGSGSDRPPWPLQRLVGGRVTGLFLVGRLPELSVELSNGLHVVSFATSYTQPQWTLFDRRGEEPVWLTVGRGKVVYETADEARWRTLSPKRKSGG